MKISRQVLSSDGHTHTRKPKILTVIVKPGWKEGTRVTFPKEGDQGPNNIPADVVFVIKYKEHPRFQRQGNNLIHTAQVSLADALCGCFVELMTLGEATLPPPPSSPEYHAHLGHPTPNSVSFLLPSHQSSPSLECAY